MALSSRLRRGTIFDERTDPAMVVWVLAACYLHLRNDSFDLNFTLAQFAIVAGSENCSFEIISQFSVESGPSDNPPMSARLPERLA
jgi:hypothetical protein